MDREDGPDGLSGGLTIRIHYADLHPEDVTTIDGIPVTTPARTLLDLASTAEQSELEQAFATAFEKHLVSASELVEVMVRYPRHPGIRRLTALLVEPGR